MSIRFYHSKNRSSLHYNQQFVNFLLLRIKRDHCDFNIIVSYYFLTSIFNSNAVETFYNID